MLNKIIKNIVLGISIIISFLSSPIYALETKSDKIEVIQPESNIYIDFAVHKAEIAPSMYGIFFEDINRATDGGIYAEMIFNRGFEENNLPSGCVYDAERKLACAPNKPVYSNPSVNGKFTIPWDINNIHPGWSLKTSGGTRYNSNVIETNPLNKATTKSFYLNIETYKNPIRLINSGFWGIAVKKGEKYLLTFYLLANPDYQGNVVAQLLDKNDQVINSNPVQITPDGNWHKYECDFIADKTINDGKFALQFNSAGILQIDYVSLFPEKTFKNRKNGFRQDVSEMLADLNPAFLRWPGGCIVEGLTMENRVKWKNTIGPPETRKGEYNLWGYHSTNGFGYHEFLNFCEDIECDGIFVCNAGMSCDGRNGDYYSDTEVEELIQDALDALEYAMGDASTKWGAKRIANGRKEPFKMRYIEIGNENHSAVYAKYYNKFYDRIRAEYPDITIMACLPFSDQLKNLKAFDMIDPHFYNNPVWFYKNFNYFDKIKREDYNVYVGEYACIVGVGFGNMDAAMSEAAFMMGMERNSDLVTMTSFAPLLENSNARSCDVNMIRIKNDDVIGRSSYYVQKMFSDNRPDVNLDTKINWGVLPREEEPAGMIGFSTWDTQIEIKSVKVTEAGKVVYKSDFVNNPGEWINQKGDWRIENGLLVQKAFTPSLVLLKSETFNSKNVEVEFEVTKRGGNEGFSLVFGAKDNLNYYQMSYGSYGNRWLIFEKITNGGQVTLNDEPPTIPIGTDISYRPRLTIKGDNWISTLNNVSRLSYSNEYVQRQYAIAGFDKAERELIIKIVNAEDNIMSTTINIDHTELESTGEMITLAASSRTDENSYEDPLKIYPVSQIITGVSDQLKVLIKPCSVNIIRLKIKSAQGIKKQESDNISIYNVDGRIMISSSPEDPLITVRVSNITGQLLFAKDKINQSELTVEIPVKQQMLIVEVDTSYGQKTQKIQP